MSNQEQSRAKPRRGASPIAAPSAFSFDEPSVDFSEAALYDKGTHFMPGDSSKIFNPRTGKYVKLEGKVGNDIVNEFGYPKQVGGNCHHEHHRHHGHHGMKGHGKHHEKEQFGGYSFDDLNNQLSQSFNDLYNSLSDAWTSLTSSGASAASSKKSKKSIRDSVRALEEAERVPMEESNIGYIGPVAVEDKFYGYDEVDEVRKPKKRHYNKRRY